MGVSELISRLNHYPDREIFRIKTVQKNETFLVCFETDEENFYAASSWNSTTIRPL
jgi:hypothetical protein